MLIHLNGWPGVGKLTIGRLLHANIGGHLLDNHAIYNVAFKLTEFRSPEFYETVRAVREVGFARVAQLPSQVPVIMTNGLNDGEWGQENWAEICQLAERWKSPLFSVILTCDPQEHSRRMASPERRYLGKLTEPEKWQPRSKALLGDDADFQVVIHPRLSVMVQRNKKMSQCTRNCPILASYNMLGASKNHRQPEG